MTEPGAAMYWGQARRASAYHRGYEAIVGRANSFREGGQMSLRRWRFVFECIQARPARAQETVEAR